MTVNQVAYWNMLESNRSNLASEAETHRHNLATEHAQLLQAQASQTQAAASWRQAEVAMQNAESNRIQSNAAYVNALSNRTKTNLEVRKQDWNEYVYEDTGRQLTKATTSSVRAEAEVKWEDKSSYWWNHLLPGGGSGTGSTIGALAKLFG